MKYRVDNIEYHINDPALFINIIDEVYKFSSFLCNFYPYYKNWFYNTHVEGIGNGRTIIFVRDKNTKKIIGICNLKNTFEEKKLCTLYIDKEYRKKGICSVLLEYAFYYLQTTKPVFSVNSKNYLNYKNIIDENNWNLKEVLGNYYLNGDAEYCYNGKLKRKIK